MQGRKRSDYKEVVRLIQENAEDDYIRLVMRDRGCPRDLVELYLAMARAVVVEERHGRDPRELRAHRGTKHYNFWTRAWVALTMPLRRVS
jgi:hypothetical protein